MAQEVDKRDIVQVQDAEELAHAAAKIIAEDAQKAIAQRGRFVIALAGGSTPKTTYKYLARDHADKIDWTKVYAFMGDERFVSPTDPLSNYGMARETLLHDLPIPEDHIYPVPTDKASPIESASAYEKTLRGYFKGEDLPRFDLILLGMGDDGHTASLFPNAATIGIRDRWVVESPAGTMPPPVDRITLTFPAINAARHVVFLVSGEKKAAALADIFENHPAPIKRPAGGVHPTDGTLTWLVDKAAMVDFNGKA